MQRRPLAWFTVFIAVAISLPGCSDQDAQDRSTNIPSKPAESGPNPVLGKVLFAANCVVCHGQGGKGTEQGPPLVHRIYEPNHHADYSFYRAVASGVRQHHWNFGDMPPIAGVSPKDVSHITTYVRREQRRAGIR